MPIQARSGLVRVANAGSRSGLLGAGLLGLAACGDDDSPSILEPASDGARRVEDLWWVLFGISATVVVIVVGFMAVALRRRGAVGDPVDTTPVPWGDRFVVLSGVVVTGAVLAGTFAYSLGALDALASPSERPELTIDVRSRNWWWEVHYPDGVVTANEIHVPVGVPVEVNLPTADVIHSFWVPELQVKKDHVPGSDNSLWLEADRAGTFRGQCAEFCGLQHANMKFLVVAQPAAEFDEWLATMADPAEEPRSATARRGRDLVTGSSCAGCHTIAGTTADGDLGPDLTHLASRETLGAGVLPLTRDNLTRLVATPQDVKPGITMPTTELTPDEVEAVVEYLMELE